MESQDNQEYIIEFLQHRTGLVSILMEEIEEDLYTINIFRFTFKYYTHYFKLMWIAFCAMAYPHEYEFQLVLIFI